MPPDSSRQVAAFPGAEGWGATALNDCRSLSLRVHRVTNVHDDGPGSLRAAVDGTSSEIFDVIVFDIGGTIELEESQILLDSDCVYVAGQTAPGDGILIRSHPTNGFNGHLIRVSQRSGVVMRFLRTRHGEEGGYSGGGIGVIGSGGGRDIILDHISATWGGGNAHLQVNRTDAGGAFTGRISFQNNLIAEGFQGRGVMMYSASDGSAWESRQWSFHRNLVATMGQRAPRVNSGDNDVSSDVGAEIVNNLMYNMRGRVSEAVYRSVIDWVGNYVDHGPHRGWQENRWGGPSSLDPIDPEDTGSLYVAGNEIRGFSDPEFESWREFGDTSKILPASMQRFSRMRPPPFPIMEMSSKGARQWVLDNVGASGSVTCNGDWVANRDEVDQRIVGYVRSRSPLETPEDPTDMTVSQINGGWPTMDSGTPCEDADGDGLPDDWERRFFGCATCADPEGVTSSGYLVIEHYLNGTDPT